MREELASLQYKHQSYQQFYITDPKLRCINKATVRDRLVHQAVYHLLCQVFDKTFLFHSLSCRKGKGTHMGVNVLKKWVRKVSANEKKTCWSLKMDVKRFFDSVDHNILKMLIRKRVGDEKMQRVIDTIIDSFSVEEGKGLPLGNVTSQLFANVYLHELDFYLKHRD